MRPPWRKSETTNQSTTKSVVNFIDRAVERVELSTRLAAFLEFTLKTAEDVVEGKTALARLTHAAAHAAHTNEPLRLHRRASLACNSRSLTIKIERVTGAGGRGHVLMVTREGITGWILSELLLFRLGSGLSVLLIENAEDTSSDLVVDDSLVIFANDVDAKLLIKRG
jgi:hypothetical protein